MIGDFHFTAICYSVWRVNLRSSATMRGATDFRTGTSANFRWTPGLVTLRQSSMQQDFTRFPLLALSQGCAVAIAFALRHPERVSHLVLYGGFAVGRFKRPNNTDADRERFAAMAALMKLGWGGDDPTFRQIFTSQMMPTATREQADAFNELQRKSASPECAVRYYETVGNFDIRSLLPRVATPTLVIHVRDDVMVPFELGREIAAGIPGARFIPLPGQNHILLEDDPGLPKLFEEVQRFLKGGWRLLIETAIRRLPLHVREWDGPAVLLPLTAFDGA